MREIHKVNTVYDEDEFHQAFSYYPTKSLPCLPQALGLTHRCHGGQVGKILKVALEQKVLYRVMGPWSIVISHLPLITFSEPGLVLDAWGPELPEGTRAVPGASDIIRHTHTRDPCAKKSTWWVITVTLRTESRSPSFSGFPLAFGNVHGSDGRWSMGWTRWPGCSALLSKETGSFLCRSLGMQCVILQLWHVGH